ncbi:MAG TPA: hypothetical protein DCF49_05655 [Lachnospiraceae bacterium]|nr:hypothetical protein [Lachnospiraceae bacterium]
MFLEVEDLIKFYGEGENRTKVLKGISTGVGKGEMCVIQGPSGSGKSTFLNCIGGLEVPDGGSIKVDGTEIVGMKGDRLSDYRREKLSEGSCPARPSFSSAEAAERHPESSSTWAEWTSSAAFGSAACCGNSAPPSRWRSACMSHWPWSSLPWTVMSCAATWKWTTRRTPTSRTYICTNSRTERCPKAAPPPLPKH